MKENAQTNTIHKELGVNSSIITLMGIFLLHVVPSNNKSYREKKTFWSERDCVCERCHRVFQSIDRTKCTNQLESRSVHWLLLNQKYFPQKRFTNQLENVLKFLSNVTKNNSFFEWKHFFSLCYSNSDWKSFVAFRPISTCCDSIFYGDNLLRLL